MSDPISIVIPTYNNAKFIESAIQSVLNQTYKNVEIIVVDDCSTDDTASVLAKYKDGIRIIRHESNQGAAVARNTGIEHSSGHLLAFLDADDKWAPEKLELCAEAFSRYPDALFAFSDFSRFKWDDGTFFALSNSQIFHMIYEIIREQKYFDRRYFPIRRADFFTLLLKGYPIYPSTMVVKKELFDSVGIWRKIGTNEDFDFSLRSCRATDCIYIDEQLSMVGRHGANLTNDIQRQLEGDIAIYNLHFADPEYSKEERDSIRYYRGRKLCGLGYNYFISGNNKQAIRKYHEAMRDGKFWYALLRIGYIAAMDIRRLLREHIKGTPPVNRGKEG